MSKLGNPGTLTWVLSAAAVAGFLAYRLLVPTEPVATPAPVTTPDSAIAAPEVLADELPVIALDQLGGEPAALSNWVGQPLVINFWATWCKPCVEELPAFEKLNAEYKDKDVEVILVSLDFPKQVEKRLKPFIKKKNLQSRVILLDDVNEDIWIKNINEKWSGAIPATLIYNKDKRMFYEQSFDYKKLQNEVHKFLN